MYPPRLIEHFHESRNVGELAPPAVTVEVSNPACGDILRLSARFEADVAVEVRYKVRGCTAVDRRRLRAHGMDCGQDTRPDGGVPGSHRGPGRGRFGRRIQARRRALRRGG